MLAVAGDEIVHDLLRTDAGVKAQIAGRWPRVVGADGEVRLSTTKVVETDEVGLCCGAAGIYTMLQPEASTELGNRKADQVRSTGVTRVASANPGCEMQLRSHLEAGYEIAHPIEWYLRAVMEPDGEGNVAPRAHD